MNRRSALQRLLLISTSVPAVAAIMGQEECSTTESITVLDATLAYLFERNVITRRFHGTTGCGQMICGIDVLRDLVFEIDGQKYADGVSVDTFVLALGQRITWKDPNTGSIVLECIVDSEEFCS